TRRTNIGNGRGEWIDFVQKPRRRRHNGPDISVRTHRRTDRGMACHIGEKGDRRRVRVNRVDANVAPQIRSVQQSRGWVGTAHSANQEGHRTNRGERASRGIVGQELIGVVGHVEQLGNGQTTGNYDRYGQRQNKGTKLTRSHIVPPLDARRVGFMPCGRCPSRNWNTPSGEVTCTLFAGDLHVGRRTRRGAMLLKSIRSGGGSIGSYDEEPDHDFENSDPFPWDRSGGTRQHRPFWWNGHVRGRRSTKLVKRLRWYLRRRNLPINRRRRPLGGG